MPKYINFLRLLKISRPRFWLYELGAFLVGAAAAYSLTQNFNMNIWLFAVFFIYFTLPANLLIYGINDIYDYETDIKNPKKTGYEDVLQIKEQPYVWKWIFATNLPFAIGLIWFIFQYTISYERFVFITFLQSPIFWSFFAFIFFASFYSAYPIRAKIKPGFDSFFSASHYIATAIFGYYLFLGPNTNLHTTELNITVIYYTLAGIFWAMAMHAFSAVPDIQADSESGIATIATALGEKKTIALCFGMYTLSSIIVFVQQYSLRNIVISLLVLPYLLIMIRTYHMTNIQNIETKDKQIFQMYKKFPIMNASAGFAIFWIIIIFSL